MSSVTDDRRPATADALENQFGLADRVVDDDALANSVERFRERGIVLPTFAELADPSTIDPARVGDADPQGPDARNLWRVHWYNDLAGDRVDVPEHVVLPSALTGVESPIIVVFGDRFPMITAHKVLAAYACLAPRIVTGQFDPTRHRAIWPSTGNYARGGIAISRIMASRGVAILPEGMSQERFDWLDRWCDDPADDVIRTPGTESNVKEIYDACNELARDPDELRAQPVLRVRQPPRPLRGHRPGAGARLRHRGRRGSGMRLAAFVSATGSAGTIAAGDRLKDTFGTRIVAVEALECPTMLENGFGEHNIQGIGDKHIPLIHNVMNTDVVVGMSRPGDRRARRAVQLRRRPGVPRRPQGRAGRRHRRARPTSGSRRPATCSPRSRRPSCSTSARTTRSSRSPPTAAAMYPSERASLLAERFGGEFTDLDAAEVFGRHLADVDTDHMIDCTARDRTRIFNLGYYTWVEQQGTPFELFEQRRQPGLLARPAPLPRRVGRDDHRVQRPRRRRRDRRLAVRRLRRDRRHRHAVPVHVPAATADRPPPRAAPADGRAGAGARSTTRTRSSPTGRASAWWAFARGQRDDRGRPAWP